MKAEYSLAVHALVYLAAHEGDISSEKLAENICTNPARVRKIMRSLRDAGLVSTKEGPQGGYCLKKPAAEISLKKVAEASGTVFVEAFWKSGGIDMDCAIASGIAGEMDAIYGKLNDSCMKMLAKISVEDVRRDLQAAPEKS